MYYEIGAVVSGVVLKKEVVILFNFFFFQGPRGGVLIEIYGNGDFSLSTSTNKTTTTYMENYSYVDLNRDDHDHLLPRWGGFKPRKPPPWLRPCIRGLF